MILYEAFITNGCEIYSGVLIEGLYWQNILKIEKILN